MRTALGAALLAVKGMAAPETGHAYARSRELWERLGHTASIFDSGWPTYDAAIAAESLSTIAVQVNGKTRGTVQVPVGAGQDQARQPALPQFGAQHRHARPGLRRLRVVERLETGLEHARQSRSRGRAGQLRAGADTGRPGPYPCALQ